MDFHENNNPPNPTQPQPMAPMYYPEKKKKGTFRRIFWGIVLGLSILANIFLFMMLISVGMFVMTGQRGSLIEEVIREGPIGTKIAVVSINGVIYAEQAENVYRQLKAARKDEHVKAVILKVDSPGGTISASDQIHQEILKFQEKTKKPIIAFMQGTAASGGYYTSVACEKIMAEPTTITGSIGVISSYIVLEELLEDKLGVRPIVIKSGEMKDVPSSFRAPSDEDIEYLQETLIQPYLKRFIEIVAEGRKDTLTLNEVEALADGSIFGAEQALQNKLIDHIGYLDDAINLIKTLAQIEEAQVVQYRRPFSLGNLLGVNSKQNLLKLDRNTLFELGSPETLYLWSAY